jgi:hypothetical protein
MRGFPRSLTDAQIERVMARSAKRLEFRAVHGTIHQLANRLGVNVGAVQYCIRRRSVYLKDPVIVAMMAGQPCACELLRRRGRGNPGKLTNAQRAIVLKWHAALIQSESDRGNTKRFSLELGVSGTTVHKCVRRGGFFKQQYRDRKAKVAKLAREPVPPSSFRNLSQRESETQSRISALRAWKRTPEAVDGNRVRDQFAPRTLSSSF